MEEDDDLTKDEPEGGEDVIETPQRLQIPQQGPEDGRLWLLRHLLRT
jgi:hypothetical protein